MALSLHEAGLVEAVPPGVVVIRASGVPVGGIGVGRDRPGFVGGRVEVTKRTGAAVTVSCETLMQEPRLRLMTRINIQNFFIPEFYFEIIRLASIAWLWLGKDQDVIAVIVEK
jgi:hypothetical protein